MQDFSKNFFVQNFFKTCSKSCFLKHALNFFKSCSRFQHYKCAVRQGGGRASSWSFQEVRKHPWPLPTTSQWDTSSAQGSGVLLSYKAQGARANCPRSPIHCQMCRGGQNRPPNNHLLRVNIDLSTFYKTCTIICDNQNPSPRALQDLEMSKYSVSSPCGAPKSRDTYRSVLQSISAGLTTKRIFQWSLS